MSNDEYADMGAVKNLACPEGYVCNADNDLKPTRCPYDPSLHIIFLLAK